jgi:2'-5' RNA ligase
MRLFVALDVPEVAKREVRRRLAAVRDRLPRAKWVDPDNLHVTLAFLGEVDAAKLPALSARLGAAFAPFEPMDLRLSSSGTFPPGRPARVAWIGVDAPREIAALHREVMAAAVETLGIEPEAREHRSHVTLARCSGAWRREAIEKLTHAFSGAIGPPFVADRGILYESRLSPSGARYRAVAEFPLSGSPSPLPDDPEDGGAPSAQEVAE